MNSIPIIESTIQSSILLNGNILIEVKKPE
jgi:hypothetical protein